LTINAETAEIIYRKITDWELEATVVERESDRTTRWIREAVKIRQEDQDVMSHVYDRTTTYYSPPLQL